MATTAINRPAPLGPAQMQNIALVLATIVAGLLLMIGVSYLIFRNQPETGTPNRIDQAQGVTPRYPPATPAEPESWR